MLSMVPPTPRAVFNDDLNSLRAWIIARWYALTHIRDKHLGSAARELKPIKHHG